MQLKERLLNLKDALRNKKLSGYLMLEFLIVIGLIFGLITAVMYIFPILEKKAVRLEYQFVRELSEKELTNAKLKYFDTNKKLKEKYNKYQDVLNDESE